MTVRRAVPIFAMVVLSGCASQLRPGEVVVLKGGWPEQGVAPGTLTITHNANDPVAWATENALNFSDVYIFPTEDKCERFRRKVGRLNVGRCHIVHYRAIDQRAGSAGPGRSVP